MILALTSCIAGSSQEKYYFTIKGKLFTDSIIDQSCAGCYFTLKGNFGIDQSGGISFSPDSTLYVLSNVPEHNLYKINLSNPVPTLVFNGPGNLVHMGGLLAMGNGIFYSIPRSGEPSDSLYIWDINAGTVTAVGQLSYTPVGEMWLANGEMYYIGYSGNGTQTEIVRIDLSNPSNSESIVTIPGMYDIVGLTATPVSTLFRGADITSTTADMVTVNIIDGTITEICNVPKQAVGHAIRQITSLYEHQYTGVEPFLDLDCDDSSLATGSDFNALTFDCFNEGGIAIADTDVVIRIDEFIDVMIFEMVNPLDGTNEIFTLSGSTPGILVDGSGTPTLTLYSEGEASAGNFDYALKQVRYDNLSLGPTGGTRVIQVSFSTQSGSESNFAFAFIEVIELPQLEVDLGPDLGLCNGSSILLEAGAFAIHYLWSTGEITESIEIDDGGTYSVTVSSNNKCPNSDDIEVEVLPDIHITLTGDTSLCSGENATLIISSDATFPVDVEISLVPGSSILFSGIEGVFEFTDIPSASTEYIITDVIPAESSCIILTDDFQIIDVYQEEIDSFAVNVCDGDSVLIAGVWQKQAGVYSYMYETIHGCDSLVNYTLLLLDAEEVNLHEETCDSSMTGIFTSYIINPDGCDTLVKRTVSLMGADTTHLYLSTCRNSEAGVLQENLNNQFGCDSLVITTISWVPPADTFHLALVSCDSMQFGVSYQAFINNDGCDSIVMIEVTEAVADTTYRYLTSCDPSSLGIFEDHFVDSDNCDSTVFTTITFSAQDSVFIYDQSCDPADTGVFVEMFTNGFGCDSVVTTTVSYQISHNISIQSSTCDPADTGVFVQTFVNHFGCDSIVTETVDLLQSDQIFFNSTTCMSSQVGEFVSAFINQYGCDSIVTLSVTLVPADTTIISKRTCDPAQIGVEQNLFTNQDGCDSLVIEQTELFPLTQFEVMAASDFNGYAISCFGESDASAMASTISGNPLNYEWSNGDTGQLISGLGAGIYSVTITDINGCTSQGSVTINEPEKLSMLTEISQPDCVDGGDGRVTVIASGGIPPIQYSTDGINFQTSSIFIALPSGPMEITIRDINNCEAKEMIWINEISDVQVELGVDKYISTGESISLDAIINIPNDSLAEILWTGVENSGCPQCLSQIVAPVATTTYTISVTDLNGCVAVDMITLFVNVKEDIFIPNIFSPNGDQINDRLIINGGSSLKEISSFIIYDRWGNIVFSADHFQPGDNLNSWDGRMKGKELNPGVFAYRLIAQFVGGREEIRYGDVTLVR